MNKGKVLIVDDEKELRRAIRRYLELEDYVCLEAKNGKEALKIINCEEIALVVSDIRMPGGDGIELLKAIKNINAKIPVVLLVTGFSEINRNEAISLGALDLLNKPIDMDWILNYLDSHKVHT